jgi:cytochrome o ubiquinol oxidase subunit 1
VSGVLMAVPAIDFQVHNTMFLVAHFHNVIIGGVVFGFFAGITYWFPKIFGFKLHDGLGRLSALFWQVGFLLAFIPLYILGLMGAVRRIDSYSDPSWQPLFITSGIGVLVIAGGILLFIVQLAYSTLKRKERRDENGDPWDGRTLEWSVPSPAPHYNFAVLPIVTERDEWWHRKQIAATVPDKKDYVDIWLPQRSGVGIMVGIVAGCFGFAVIWHLWWLAAITIVVLITVIIRRTLEDDTEHSISATELFHDVARRSKV